MAMKVAKSDAVKLLVGVGVKNASSLNAEKLQAKLESLPELTKGQMGKLDKGSLNLYKALSKAKEDEKDIKIEADKASKNAKAKKAEEEEDDDEDEDDEDAGAESDDEEEEGDDDEGEEEDDDEASESDEEDEEGDDDEDDDDDSEDSEDEEEEDVSDKKKGKKDKKKQDAGKKGGKAKGDKKKVKKETAARDRFGMREGTRAARLNSAITGKAKTIQQIMKDARYDKPIHGHMNKLVSDGYVVKVKMKDGGSGYKETGKKYKPE